MRPMDVRGGTAAQGGNRVHAGQEVSMRIIMKIGAAVCLIIVMMASFLIDEFPFIHGLLMMDANFFLCSNMAFSSTEKNFCRLLVTSAVTICDIFTTSLTPH
jgi:hypothetical protein